MQILDLDPLDIGDELMTDPDYAVRLLAEAKAKTPSAPPRSRAKPPTPVASVTTAPPSAPMVRRFGQVASLVGDWSAD